MAGRRRNDTNQPRPGNASATTFDHQSDMYPQTIGVRTFNNGLPHPVLSISTLKRPSGIIDVMPDHPHEGECKQETSFTVNGVTIDTQILATSFVPGGNTSGGKAATIPHCFPSIAVWDGKPAKAGRIVVDSTWHHFVNINLNGVGSGETGLSADDFECVRQYYMNISVWMTRPPSFFCLRRWIIWELLRDSQLIEATLDNPIQDRNEIKLSDLNSIGSLAEELLAAKFGSAMARSILVDLISDASPQVSKSLEAWSPVRYEQDDVTSQLHDKWFNHDLLLHVGVGSGFIALRDDKKIAADKPREDVMDGIAKVFSEGVSVGMKAAFSDLQGSMKQLDELLR